MQQRPRGLQNLKCFLPGPLGKVCWPHTLNEGARPAAWAQGQAREGGRGVALSPEGRLLARTASEKCAAFGSPSPPQPSRVRPQPGLCGGVSLWGTSSCPPVGQRQEVASGTQHCSVPVPKMHDERGHRGTAAVGRGQGPESSLGSGERGCSSQEEGEPTAALGPVGVARGSALEVPTPGGLRRSPDAWPKPGARRWPGGQWREQEDRGPAPAFGQKELRKKTVQGEVVPFSVLPGPFL